MSRKQYLQISVVLLFGIPLAILALALWVIMLIPAMIYPAMIKPLSSENVASFMMRKTMQAMRGRQGNAATARHNT